MQKTSVFNRGSLEVSIGAALLVLSALLGLRAAGAWFSDALVWPAMLIVIGTTLLWRRSTATEPVPDVRAASVPPDVRAREETEEVRERARVASRTGVGIALVITAGLAFLQATGALTAARDVVLAVIVVLVVLGVIFAPLVLRMTRSLSAERAERIRSQERAEMAAHLHDSVLQTLAMVQRSDDPREVATLARRQERELRSWLGGRSQERAGRLALALDHTAAEVEEMHGVNIDVVAVGDRDLDAAGEALVAAAREAMVNAAKFGGGAPVAVYAEADDRRGVRESIVGRMERHGGRARIVSSPQGGTEVELVLEARP